MVEIESHFAITKGAVNMIYLWGANNNAEYHAAETLRASILKAWPTAETDSEYTIHLVANAKWHGQRFSDVDILLFAICPQSARFRPYTFFTDFQGNMIRPEVIEVASLCIAIEVKDHDAADVQFEGNKAYVRYRGVLHDASEQSHGQKSAVFSYLKANGYVPPFVHNIVWLRNVSPSDLPQTQTNIIGSNMTWDVLLNTLMSLQPPRYESGIWLMDAFRNSSDAGAILKVFTQKITPTHLDRKRMERINQMAAQSTPLDAAIGQKLTILRGRAGTGKTSRLLQLARRLYDQDSARVLLLTYNNALVADIGRLITLMGIPDNIAQSSIQIQTAHSFFLGILGSLGMDISTVTSGANGFNDSAYENLKQEALTYLRAGVLGQADIQKIKHTGSQVFSWDYVFVDEAQDWPDNERELLFDLFGPQNLVIADGVDQLVRREIPLNWQIGLSASQVHKESLEICLRMKVNLTRFVDAFADALGLNYAMPKASQEVRGGKVLVIEGSYFANRNTHEQLLARNQSDGNASVDMLFCVPPQSVTQSLDDIGTSIPSKLLQQWGYTVWDGTVDTTRRAYPTSVEQHRIVRYDSCRGLEGWIVVHFGLDHFFNYKYNQALEVYSREPSSLSDPAEQATLRASQWLLIPLTRAMDTLVIQISKEASPVRKALEEAYRSCPDFMEWYTL